MFEPEENRQQQTHAAHDDVRNAQKRILAAEGADGADHERLLSVKAKDFEVVIYMEG